MAHREYIVDGVRYPSVTEILGDEPKPWLERWRTRWGKRAEQKTRAATDIGSAFHKIAEKEVCFSPSSAHTRRLWNMKRVFRVWISYYGFKAIDVELHVISKEYKYQGTFDAVGYLKDKPRTLAIFDWKTSSGIYADMPLQLAAYAQAYFEQTGKRITRGIIVHISKDKPHHKLTIKEYYLGKWLINKFLKRLSEYRERHNEPNVNVGKEIQGSRVECDPAAPGCERTVTISYPIPNTPSNG